LTVARITNNNWQEKEKEKERERERKRFNESLSFSLFHDNGNVTIYRDVMIADRVHK